MSSTASWRLLATRPRAWDGMRPCAHGGRPGGRRGGAHAHALALGATGAAGGACARAWQAEPHIGALSGACMRDVGPIMKLFRGPLGGGLEAMPAPPGHRCDQTGLPVRPQGATCTGQPAGCSRYTAVTLNKPLDFERGQKFFYQHFWLRGVQPQPVGPVVGTRVLRLWNSNVEAGTSCERSSRSAQ